MMLQHLSNNIRAAVLTVLSVVLIAIYFIDYEYLFDASSDVKNQPLPESIEEIDHYLHKYSYAQYKNIIDDNIFIENVIVATKTHKKINPKNEILAMRLEIWGIVTTPDSKMVLIWDKVKKESHVLLEKDHFNKWQVLSINRHDVVFVNESGEMDEVLFNKEKVTDLNIIR